MRIKALWILTRRLSFLIILGYGVICLGIWHWQEILIFHPQPASLRMEKDLYGEDIWLTTDDGVVLHGRHYPQVKKPKGIVLYFHGNGGNVHSSEHTCRRLWEEGFTCMLFDYRGYGLSNGKIRNEVDLYADADAMYSWASQQYGGEDISLFGSSLGTGLASYIADKYPHKNRVLFAPYYDFNRVLKENTYGVLPIRKLSRYHMKNHTTKDLSANTTILHGENDHRIKFENGKDLAQNFGYELISFSNTGHSFHHDEIYESLFMALVKNTK